MKVPIKLGVSFTWPSTRTLASDDPLDWQQRGAQLYAAGDREGAEQAYTRYLEAPVRDPALRAVIDAIASDDLIDADTLIRAFLSRRPSDPVAYRLFGQVTLRREDHAGAETIFRRSLGLVPNFAPLRYELALALAMQGKTEEALSELESLLRIDRQTVAYGALRAELLGKIGEFESAAESYRALIADYPADAALLVAYGQMLRTLRRRDDAIEAFRCAINLNPTHGEAWWNLANLKTGTLTGEDIDALRTAVGSDQASATDLFHLRFALARALEESGSFEASFAEYRRANAAREALFPPTTQVNTTDHVHRVITLFTPSLVAARRSVGDASNAPIFILGMPRSGSTLLEQILAQHPDIEGTQELPDLPAIANELHRSSGDRVGYPEVLARQGPDRLRELGADYLQRTKARRKTDRPFFIDKQPANWLHVGLIKLILPNARIIDARRGALGCCLSMFRQHFARGATFTYSLERLATEYRAYHQLMAYFAEIMPGAIYRVELEALVANLEGSVRAVLDQLGLPFSPECLRFFDSPRAVFTPSSEQVRRPINQESAELLQDFAPYVGELKALLGDLAN